LSVCGKAKDRVTVRNGDVMASALRLRCGALASQEEQDEAQPLTLALRLRCGALASQEGQDEEQPSTLTLRLERSVLVSPEALDDASVNKELREQQPPTTS